MAAFDRWLARTGHQPRPGALNWTPMSDSGHAAGGGWHLANTSKVIDKRAARAPVSFVMPGAAAGDAQQPWQRVEVLWPRRRGL